ncbi:MAG: hypothetical protein JNJ43_12830 [Anaerolineales bacterium]|nr:hypothetical protein [Anaerolineales bacterium]
MKKTNKKSYKDYDDGMLPEYDFTGKKPIRGKYYKARQQGYTVRIHNEDGTVTEKHFGPTITLEPDIAIYFPDSESVNKALRTLISIIPTKQVGETKAKYKISKKPKKKIAAKK